MQAVMYTKLLLDTTSLERDYNYKPQITVNQGIHEFVSWYKGFYKNKDK